MYFKIIRRDNMHEFLSLGVIQPWIQMLFIAVYLYGTWWLFWWKKDQKIQENCKNVSQEYCGNLYIISSRATNFSFATILTAFCVTAIYGVGNNDLLTNIIKIAFIAYYHIGIWFKMWAPKDYKLSLSSMGENLDSQAQSLISADRMLLLGKALFLTIFGVLAVRPPMPEDLITVFLIDSIPVVIVVWYRFVYLSSGNS